MTNALPLRPSIDHTPRDRSTIDLADDAATDVLGSLASETSQSIVTALANEPATATDLASHVDTSLQNVHYHLGKLRAAGVVTVVGTWYSAKGKEMTVYALTSEEIEIRIGSDRRSARVEPS